MRIYPTNPIESETLHRARVEALKEGVTYGRWILAAVKERLDRIDTEKSDTEKKVKR
jgi:hypothetical protein